jgi:hypothetical protein
MTTEPCDPRQERSQEEGIAGGGSLGGTALLLVGNFPILAQAAAGGAAYMTYKWFMYRAKRGMRF